MTSLLAPQTNRDLWSHAGPYSEATIAICDQPIIIVSDSLIVTFLNEAAVGLLGASKARDVVGRSIRGLIKTDSGEFFPDHLAGVGHYQELTLHRCDGAMLPVGAALLPCLHGKQRLLQMLIRDHGVRGKLESRLRFVVRHDILTELPNRTEFRDRLIGAMARAQRNSRQLVVALINIDAFKAINLEHGADGGDAVLQEVARRLRMSIRGSDSVARLAGDEFGLILEGIDQREQGAVVANRVLTAFKATVDFSGARLAVTVSVGLAGYPDDARDTDDLLRTADVAMYAAKATGAGSFRFYFPDMEAATQRDRLRLDQIRRNIKSLTKREREVMEVLVEGNSNKAIAYMLGASPRTIENHRAKVMEKMGADSLPELVRMVLESTASAKAGATHGA